MCVKIWSETNRKTIFILQKRAMRIQSKTTYSEATKPFFVENKVVKSKDVNKLLTIQIIDEANRHHLTPRISKLFLLNNTISGWCDIYDISASTSLPGPSGCRLRRVWPELPESRPGVLLVSEEPHGNTLGKHHTSRSSTTRRVTVPCVCSSGQIDTSTATTPSPAWISPPTPQVSWLWGWSMAPLPSMMCRPWRTRPVSSAAGKNQAPSGYRCGYQRC